MPGSRVKTKRRSSYANKTPHRYSDIHQTICEAERNGHIATITAYKAQHRARFAPQESFQINLNRHQWRRNFFLRLERLEKAYNTRTDHGYVG